MRCMLEFVLGVYGHILVCCNEMSKSFFPHLLVAFLAEAIKNVHVSIKKKQY